MSRFRRLVLDRPLRTLRTHRRAYLALNALAYGAVLLGLVLGMVLPQLNAWALGSMQADGSTDLAVSMLFRPWVFAPTILAINLLTVAIGSILLPSMVVPFAGIAIFAVRALLIGITLAPHSQELTIALIPHSVTVILEVQAYVILLLGALLLARSWLRPSTVDADSHRSGYLEGLRSIARLGPLALALLVVGAVYEALSLAYVVPALLAA